MADACYSSFPQRCYSYRGNGTTIKRTIVPIKDALGYLRETQRYIQSISEKPRLKGGRPRMKEVLFPAAPIAAVKKSLGGHSTLPSPKKSSTARDFPTSLSELSLFHKHCLDSPNSDYTVTSYMLTRPVSTRHFAHPSKRAERAQRAFVNPQIEQFLNRFERQRERVPVPSIVLSPQVGNR